MSRMKSSHVRFEHPRTFRRAGEEHKGKKPTKFETLRPMRPLRMLTTDLLNFYKIMNPNFNYDSKRNPRRILTKPSRRVGNNKRDNAQANLIICVGDVLENLAADPPRRYRVVELLGQGTFGQVVSCEVFGTSEKVAVKIIKNKPAYFNQALVEVRILKMLNEKYDKDNKAHTLRMFDSFQFQNHLCIVFELLSVNLYELVKQNHFRGLSCNLIRTFVKQLLEALCVLKEAQVIHCDLKPENILLENLMSARIKLIDFGSACFERQTIYSYIQSRFYRSPEVLLGVSYTAAIDMWSLGCIAMELFLGLPLLPGVSQYNQIARIIEMLDMPPSYLLHKGKKTKKFFHYNQETHKYTLKSPHLYARENKTTPQPRKKYFKGTTLRQLIDQYPLRRNMPEAEKMRELGMRKTLLHFITGLLSLDPEVRWEPGEAKRHPFVNGKPISEAAAFEAQIMRERTIRRRQQQLDRFNRQFPNTPFGVQHQMFQIPKRERAVSGGDIRAPSRSPASSNEPTTERPAAPNPVASSAADFHLETQRKKPVVGLKTSHMNVLKLSFAQPPSVSPALKPPHPAQTPPKSKHAVAYSSEQKTKATKARAPTQVDEAFWDPFFHMDVSGVAPGVVPVVTRATLNLGNFPPTPHTRPHGVPLTLPSLPPALGNIANLQVGLSPSMSAIQVGRGKLPPTIRL